MLADCIQNDQLMEGARTLEKMQPFIWQILAKMENEFYISLLIYLYKS